MNKNIKTLIADTGLVYCAAIWGATFFMVKDAIGQIDAVALVGYRFLIAAALILAYLLFKGENVFQNLKQGAVLGIFLWLIYIPQTIGLKYTSAANSGFITGLFILFVPLFSVLTFKQRPSKMKWIAVFVALAGLYVLTGGLKEVNPGDVLTLLTSVAYALHLLFADKYAKKKSDPLIMSFQQFLFVGVLSLAVMPFFKISYAVKDIGVIWPILFLAIFPTISAFVIQLTAQRFTTPVKCATIFSLEPVFAALFAWTIGGERASAFSAFGGGIIVAAMIIAEMPEFEVRLFWKRKLALVKQEADEEK